MLVVVAAVISTAAAVMLITTTVLGFRAVAGFADVALAVMCFVGMKVGEGPRSMLRVWALIAVVGIVAVIDVAVEAVRAVKPGAGSDKDSADEPVGPKVTVRRALIRRVVEVAVRAYRGDADADGDLSRCDCASRQSPRHRESQARKRFSLKHVYVHSFFLLLRGT
jgi:hypothetical protein